MTAGYSVKFHWLDYLLFSLSLAITVIVGIVLAIRQKWHQQTSEDYLMANRKMNWFLVGLSFWASIMSSTLIVLFTAEFYYSGIVMVWVGGAVCLAGAFVVIVIIPKFFRLGVTITSAYEYFELRFSLPVRILVAIFYFLLLTIYLAVALYIPCLVLSQVSEIGIYWCIFLGAAVCLIYTGFGGIKAVIYVDSIQILIIAAGMLALIIQGSADAGGIKQVWRIYADIGDRDNWDDTKTDPWDKYNILTMVLMLGIFETSFYGADQTELQRFMTVPDMRLCQRSVIIGCLIGLVFVAMTCVAGMVGFALVGGNEPLRTGDINTQDQILPYFLMVSLGRYHGLPGVVVAAIFAATLSTLSSGQNALVAVCLEDFIRPIYRLRTGNALSERAAGVLSKIIGVSIGVATLAIGMAVPNISGTLLSIALSMQTFILGPLFGLMLVGFFMVWVESWGAFVGMLSSVVWGIMMWSGARVYGNNLGADARPLFLNNFTKRIDIVEPTATPNLFDVSFLWYMLLDIVVLAVVSSLISLLSHVIKKCTRKDYSIRDTFPSKDLRYTVDDFLVAIGYRKNTIEYNKPQEMVITGNTNEQSDADGMDNLAQDI